VAMCQAGIEAARRPEEKRLVLARLGEIRDPRALPVLEAYLTDKTLGDDAAAAMVSVADKLLPGGWQESSKAIEQALGATRAEPVRQRAAQILQRVTEMEDFAIDWQVAGPFTQKGKDGTEILDVVFPPEQPEAPRVEWKSQPVSDDPERYWFLDLNRSIGGSDRAAYLRTRVRSPSDQRVRLEIGSDDGVKVWLNGELIHNHNVPRGCERGADKVEAPLKGGWNDLLLKVANGGGDWGACLRIRALDGSHLDGVLTKTQQEN